MQKLKKNFFARKRFSHKGDYGRVFVVAGAKGYSGAAYLTSMAAMRSGAGLVTLGVPETIYSILARRHAEVMVRGFPSTKKGSFAYAASKPVLEFVKTQGVIALGPGLSQEPSTQKFVRKIIDECTGRRPVRGRVRSRVSNRSPKDGVRLVIDADGLNALKGHLDLFKKCMNRAIITPHPGEFKRLFGNKGGTGLKTCPQTRRKRAVEVAKRHKLVVLLKGYQTVVADPNGKIYVNKTGNPGMATGGSGDVLSGIIAALVGQKFPLFEAACLGAHVHGLTGDLAARDLGQVSLIASDLLDYLPQAFRSISY